MAKNVNSKPIAPLKRAHAHNDYEHARPLFDALDHGFCRVEADICLTADGLMIGHFPWRLKPGRTLQSLYLDPLKKRIEDSGVVLREAKTFYLMIDVKTGAKEGYAALDKVLAKYRDILSVIRDGKFEEKPVTVVISGNCDRESIAKQPRRYAAIDGGPGDLDSDAPAHLIPWISARWGAEFDWDGNGPMPDKERAKLKDFVTRAHKHRRLVRFWAAPEKESVWEELLAANVDLINSDRLAELQQFLMGKMGVDAQIKVLKSRDGTLRSRVETTKSRRSSADVPRPSFQSLRV
jgi:hypothetical protein